MIDLLALIDINLPLNPQACWWVLIALFQTTWQVCLISLVVAVFLRHSAASVFLRFRIAWLALMLVGSLPLLNFVWVSGGEAPLGVKVATDQYQLTGNMRLFALRQLRQPYHNVGELSGAIDTSSHVAEATNSVAATSKSEARLSWSVVLAATVTIGYVVGVLLMILRLGRGLQKQQQLSYASLRTLVADQSDDRSAFILPIARRAANLLGRSLQTPVALWAGQGTAFVVGILRPVVLVNTTIVSGLTPVQIEQILIHELAHVYRFDPLTQLAQRVVEAVLFFHPAVWWLSGAVSQLREQCCDAWTVQTHCPAEYADTLLQCFLLQQSNRSQPEPELALAALGGKSNHLASRIDALLNVSPSNFPGQLQRSGKSPQSIETIAPAVRRLLMVCCGLVAASALAWPVVPLLTSFQTAVSVDNSQLLAAGSAVENHWHWQHIEPDEVQKNDLVLNGRRLPLVNECPADIELLAMVTESDCRFAQWHFGDGASVRLAIAVEVQGGKVERVFLDSNRNRKIESDEEVTTKIVNDSTWVTNVTAAVKDGKTTVHGKRQIAITPKRSIGVLGSNGPDMLRVTTLGFAVGEVDLGDQRYAVRRVDKDGDGLPNGASDELWIDLNADGQFDFISEVYTMANSIELQKQRFNLRSDRLGHRMQMSAATESAWVKFIFTPQGSGATVDALEGALRDEDGMLIAVRLSDEPIAIPPGRYCLENLFVQTRDADQTTWRMTLNRRTAGDWIEVKAGQHHDIELLTGFTFAAESVYKPDSWSGHLTHLQPSLTTDNGLSVTKLVQRKRGADPHTRQLLDTATFRVSNTLESFNGDAVDQPAANCSGFS